MVRASSLTNSGSIFSIKNTWFTGFAGSNTRMAWYIPVSMGEDCTVHPWGMFMLNSVQL